MTTFGGILWCGGGDLLQTLGIFGNFSGILSDNISNQSYIETHIVDFFPKRSYFPITQDVYWNFSAAFRETIYKHDPIIGNIHTKWCPGVWKEETKKDPSKNGILELSMCKKAWLFTLEARVKFRKVLSIFSPMIHRRFCRSLAALK